MAMTNGYNNQQQALAEQYRRSKILTASPAELTLMLYEGAIKFCNIAIMAIEKGDMERAHIYIKKTEDIIVEFRSTLDRKYKVAEDFDRVYVYIYDLLVEGNIKKDIEILTKALNEIRGMRDTWKKVMEKTKGTSPKNS